MSGTITDTRPVPAAPDSGATASKAATVAVIGNPNTGKSTLFNALTGLRQKVGNYPGVTVEKHIGHITIGDTPLTLVDLPGSYSLAAFSPDELIAIDVLLGRVPGEPRPDAVLVVVDAANLRRNLYLASQVLELGLPVVVALNMIDVAAKKNIAVDAAKLGEKLGAVVVPTAAASNRGLDELRAALLDAVKNGKAPTANIFPELREAAAKLAAEHSRPEAPLAAFEVERALIDAGAAAEERMRERHDAVLVSAILAQRETLGNGKPLAAVDAAARYRWIAAQLEGVEERGTPPPSWTDRIDAVITHPVAGTLVFIVIMAIVFQAVFTWAVPLMDLIDGAFVSLAELATASLGEGPLSSFIADGLIGGVGAVVIFLPQILILFLFIAILEDSGYMARAAFLMDRVMRFCGLSGQSFVPMLSSFACAIPGIMATRTIPDRRDRLTTILVSPLMSCSARLPVYTILIAAFIPDEYLLGGWVSLRGLVMLSMYLIGIVAAILAATIIKRLILRGPTPTFLMELPTYKWPQFKAVAIRLYDRGKAFLVRAGTVIFVVIVCVWLLSYFPRSAEITADYDARRAAAETQLAGDDAALETAVAAIDHAEEQAHLENSFFGRIGHGVAPLFRPLGWDWRVSAAAIASFPAREVVVAVMGTTFSLGSDIDTEEEDGETAMTTAMHEATHADGTPLFTVPMALGLMVFFALCMQCAATLATIKRETNSWGWPIFAWVYMTGLAYVAALIVYQGGTALGF